MIVGEAEEMAEFGLHDMQVQLQHMHKIYTRQNDAGSSSSHTVAAACINCTTLNTLLNALDDVC